MSTPLRVNFFTLTRTPGSEHIYRGALRDALEARGVVPVENPADADLVHLFEVNFFTRETIKAFRIPKLLRLLRSETPVVVSTDDLYFIDEPELTARPSFYRPNHYAQRWLLRQCDGVIAISESVKDHLELYLTPETLHVVHHGVAAEYFTSEPEANPPYILHVSLASKRKNPEAIRHAARHLDGRFVIAGSGWADRIPDGPEYANVETPGFVPEDDLIQLYAGASVFYYPTLHEGFGLPVLEAMAAGNAVVSSDVYAVPEVVGETGILCDPLDLDDHLRHLRRLLSEDGERRELAAAASRRARGFTWDRAAERTQRVYRHVLEES